MFNPDAYYGPRLFYCCEGPYRAGFPARLSPPFRVQIQIRQLKAGRWEYTRRLIYREVNEGILLGVCLLSP